MSGRQRGRPSRPASGGRCSQRLDIKRAMRNIYSSANRRAVAAEASGSGAEDGSHDAELLGSERRSAGHADGDDTTRSHMSHMSHVGDVIGTSSQAPATAPSHIVHDSLLARAALQRHGDHAVDCECDICSAMWAMAAAEAATTSASSSAASGARGGAGAGAANSNRIRGFKRGFADIASASATPVPSAAAAAATSDIMIDGLVSC